MLICLSWRTLCNSKRLPLSVLSFIASCSASSLVWAFPSIRRFSLCTDSSDKATTFCSISTSMFWSSKNKEANSYILQHLPSFLARRRPEDCLIVFQSKSMPSLYHGLLWFSPESSKTVLPVVCISKRSFICTLKKIHQELSLFESKDSAARHICLNFNYVQNLKCYSIILKYRYTGI